MGNSRVRRAVLGSTAFVLAAATVAGLATGASGASGAAPHAAPHAAPRAATHHAERPAPTPAPAALDARVVAARAAARLVAARPALLKAGRHDVLTAGPVQSSLGLHYVPYERTYRGLPVVGGDAVVATDDTGRVVATSVAQTRRTRLRSARPTVTRAAARRTSAHHVERPVLGRTRLVVLQRTRSHLAWETGVAGVRRGRPSRLTVYVDARTGRVLSRVEHVLEGTGTGNWEGTVPLPTSGSGSSFSMTDKYATSLTCQDSGTGATFTGPDDAWGNGSATDRETGCVDALYSADEERQMLATWLGRNGMDGAGGWVPIRVGLNDVNAYYDGTQVQIGHTWSGGKWIGAMDVVAHEFGHGVDHRTPGGISGGGTQEFIADTFGAATEWFANNPADAPDFTVGEEVNLVGNGPIRYMYNPSLAGDANCWSASTPTSEVHSAAGPGNHWYYLLAEGTSPTNGQPVSPTCNGSTLTGIGVQKTQQILYNAMLLKTSASSYLTYRTGTLTAAKNLFPGSCTEFNAVKAAWDAVSVPAQAADPTCSATPPVAVTNPGAKAATVGTALSFTLAATGGTGPYTWAGTGLPAGVAVSAAGAVSGTPTTAGTYPVTVTVTATKGGTASATFTVTVAPLPPVVVTNPGARTGTVGTPLTAFTLAASGGAAPYAWSATGLPAGVAITAGGTVSGTPSAAGTYSVRVTATAAKGGSASATFTVTVAALPPVTVTNPGPRSGTFGVALTSFSLVAGGGAAPYSWTATGLPPGVVVSSTGVVSGKPTTAGAWTTTVTATAAKGGSASATFAFTVAAPSCTGQKLVNPGFETGTAAPWSATTGVVDNVAVQPAHTGAWKAWFDGYGTTHVDTLTQTVAIPAGCHATLTFWLHVDSAETTTSQPDTFTVKLGTTTLGTFSNRNSAAGYTLRTFDASALAGQTVTLTFTGAEDAARPTSFVVDDAALTVS